MEKNTQSLKKQIQELEGVTREVNQDTLDALEKLRVIKEKTVDANAEIAKKKKIIEQLCTPSSCPITLNPSKIMGRVDMNEDFEPE